LGLEVPLSSLPAYLAFAALGIAAPGIALQRLARVPVEPALVLPLGTASVALAYWLSLAVGPAWLGPALLGGLGAALLLPRPQPARPRAPSSATGTEPMLPHGRLLRIAAPPVLAIVALLALTQYARNRPGPSGEFLLDALVPYDTAFHVGLTRELTLGYPPQLPGVSGFPLGYHLGTDLVRAAALSWAGVDPYDAISRLDVTLGALGLVLALIAAARAAGAPHAAVALAPWTLLATDFSFAFAGNPQAHWWADLLRGNVLISLCLANPVVPGLTLALGCLVALSRRLSGGGAGWLALAAAQAAAVPFFKVFLGAHLLLGLAVAGLRCRRFAPVAIVALPCAAATALLALGQGSRTVEVAFAPLDLVRVTRDSLGLEALSAWTLLGWSGLWLAASLGLRILGLPAAVAALRAGPPAGTALAAMALAAWPIGLLFRVSAPEALPGQKVVNDAAYVVEQGGPLLWVFTAMAVARVAGAGRRGAAVLAAAAALALPSTFQFAVKKAGLPPDPLPAAIVRAMAALESASRPGDVVLQRPGARYPPAPVVLIGRRVPYQRFTPYLTQFASVDDLTRRHETVYRFFHTADASEAAAIASRLDARFVCLYGPDRLRFDPSGLLEPIHEEPGARVYRIRAAPDTR